MVPAAAHQGQVRPSSVLSVLLTKVVGRSYLMFASVHFGSSEKIKSSAAGIFFWMKLDRPVIVVHVAGAMMFRRMRVGKVVAATDVQ